jgi:hypothetical protein
MSEEMSVYERALAKEKAIRQRKRPSHVESDLQMQCVKWFAYQHQALRPLLFSVPNGGRRDARTGAILKAEGVHAGVADMILFVPNKCHHALCIEMKTATGSQSKLQKEWQAAVEAMDYKYVVCRSLDDFMREVTEYLNMGYPVNS